MVGEKEKKRKKSRAGKGGPASVSSLQPPLSVGDVTVNPLSAPPSPPLLPLSPDTPIHAAALFTRPLPHSPGVLSATSHELNAFSVPLCLGERESCALAESPSERHWQGREFVFFAEERKHKTDRSRRTKKDENGAGFFCATCETNVFTRG